MTKYFDDKQLYPLLLQNDFSKVLSFLEKYGYDSVDRNGRNFLMNCIAEGKNDFAYKLIELGANLNHQDASGASPFFSAIWSKNLDMIDYLLDSPNVDKKLRTIKGKMLSG
ncbi:ankyrin repeat domain-containing protein [Bacteroides cellulosilyticus]|uniref:ankyrin repeat domain-containing protein n=1 Tax=Bacteroides cellulosilyticus TaxID=246787 RepID=UPI0032F079FC